MAKTLVFRRTEFVREYYEVQWIEEDYQNFLNYLSEQTDDHNIIRYGILKPKQSNTNPQAIRNNPFKNEHTFDIV